MEVVIRPLQPGDDFVQLTELLHRAYAQLAEMGFRYTATYQTPEITRNRCETGTCLLAILDERVVGTVTYYHPQQTCHADWYDRLEVASFGQFGVDPPMQGAGIGARLMDAVEALAKADGAAELACDTAEGATHLIEMYERKGYRRVGTVDWRDTNYMSVILSKEIGR